MRMHLARLMSMFSARTLRHGGDFAGPDLSEEDLIDELEAETESKE